MFVSTAVQSALIALLAVVSVPAGVDLRAPAVMHKVVDDELRDLRADAADIDDSRLTARVQVALRADPRIRARWISVASSNGHVALSGKVDSPNARDAAEAIAGAVPGVRAVQNNLQMLAPQQGRTTAASMQRSDGSAAGTAMRPRPLPVLVSSNVLTFSPWLQPRASRVARRIG